MSNLGGLILNGCAIFVQSLLPRACLLCGEPSGQAALCPACHAELPWHEGSQCPRCALPTLDGAVCGRCLGDSPSFDRTFAAFTYAFPVDALIRKYKYGQRLVIAPVLADALARRTVTASRPDVIIPMPLHPDRLQERGFNQALEVAKLLSRNLDIPLRARGAERMRATRPQVELPWKERAKNLRGAFAARSDVGGKHVALVDDVMTSGASLDELARTLRRAGATEISAWVVARTVADR